jgi:hypothetical protein
MSSSPTSADGDAPAGTRLLLSGGAVLSLLALAYVGSVVTVGVLGRPMQWMMPALGVLSLIGGVLMAVGLVGDLWKRVVLRRHGVTVTAVWDRNSWKNRRYTFTDTEGRVHEYRSRQHVAAQIQVTYDPRDPRRAFAPPPLAVRVLETGGTVIVTGVFLKMGIAFVPVQLVLVLVG